MTMDIDTRAIEKAAKLPVLIPVENAVEPEENIPESLSSESVHPTDTNLFLKTWILLVATNPVNDHFGYFEMNAINGINRVLV